MNQKIKTQEQIQEIAEQLRKQGKKIVTTNGSFDILHTGHTEVLKKAKQLGDKLIVMLNSDKSIKRFKGNSRPIINENERAKLLSALESVDYVVIFNEDKPLELMKKIKPNFHAKGGSFIPERIKEEANLLATWGGQFKSFELEGDLSTTNIINKILEKHKHSR